jgi:hypothetical protein
MAEIVWLHGSCPKCKTTDITCLDVINVTGLVGNPTHGSTIRCMICSARLNAYQNLKYNGMEYDKSLAWNDFSVFRCQACVGNREEPADLQALKETLTKRLKIYINWGTVPAGRNVAYAVQVMQPAPATSTAGINTVLTAVRTNAGRPPQLFHIPPEEVCPCANCFPTHG